jgi:hypothetical protein
MGHNMHGRLFKSSILAAIGFCYGAVLAFLGLVAAGAGHGTYVIIGLSSSPLGLTQNIAVAFFGAPFLWCLIGALLGETRRRIPRAIFLATMLAHYAAIPIILGRDYFGDWDRLGRASEVAAIALAVHALGQLVLWGLFALELRDSTRREWFGPSDLLLTLVFFVTLFVVPALIISGYFKLLRDKPYEFAAEEPVGRSTVQLVKSYTIENMPRYDDAHGQDYRDRTCAFSSGPTFHCVHPLKFGGELCTWSQQQGHVRRDNIPQPDGLKREFDFSSCFGEPSLWVSPGGDQLMHWQLGGNCDHGLALRKRGSGAFVTARSRLCLANSRAVASPDGTWYLLVWNVFHPGFELSVFAVDDSLHPVLVGRHRCPGHHTIGVLDAAFTANDRLHIIWADVEPAVAPNTRVNWLRMRTIDLDVRRGLWLDERERWRLDRFVSSVSPAVHVLEDGSIHYLWSIDEGQTRTTASGLFCQRQDTGQTIKLADNYLGFKSLALGNQIVVCYALENRPDSVYFRVIAAAGPGPVTAVKLARPTVHALWAEDFVLGNEAGQGFWFVNTLDVKTLYQLRVVESN